MKNRIIKDNTVAYATLPRKYVINERRVMTLEEQKIFLYYAKNSNLYELIEVALSTGMRSGELRGLCWSDIDFKNKTLHIKHSLNYYGNEHVLGLPKTKTSIRDIPMLDNVERILKNIKKEQSKARMKLGENWKEREGLENLVFTTGCGGPLNRALLAKEMNRIIKRIQNDKPEFEHISPHTFRHTFATRCIEAGMSPQVLKTILGHSKLSQTMDLYAHVLQDTKAEEMKRIANLF